MLLEKATALLANVTDTPRLEAEILLAHVLKKPRSFLLAHGQDVFPKEIENQFFDLIARRVNQEPIAYLTRHKEFWSLDLEVEPGVLIPRPETELLVELVLALPGGKLTIADLGTGSGAIALAIASERKQWEVIATDQSATALAVAKRNASKFQLNNVVFFQGSWIEALPTTLLFDAIVSNPPYIAEHDPHLKSDLRYEPQEALVSGKEGLDAISEIISQAKKVLKPGGWLFLEHGATQGAAVRALLKEYGFNNICTEKDLAGLDRVTAGRERE